MRWSLLAPIAAALLLSACATTMQTPSPTEGESTAAPAETPDPSKTAPGSDRYTQKHDSGPPPTKVVDVAKIPQPKPKPENPSKYGNHSPYTVFGETYHVLPSSEGYVAEGIASWYGSKFHGHRTSSGEPYDMYQFTAAHRSLPLPTFARVTNLDNNKSVIVRINDRGPFHPDREIDLSWAAAKALDIDQNGTGRVRVEVMSTTQRNVASATGGTAKKEMQSGIHAAADSPPPPGEMYLQLGAYAQADRAQWLQKELLQKMTYPVAIRPLNRDGQRLYRLWVGPFNSESSLKRAEQELKGMGYRNTVRVTP
ncbi:MAG TPA: septal ring lytic transglycosylase RlpA family protein [Alcanivoracaceae bacterium]|nr:septal ring lytic transglycosylase RlpA family protein [Alcanivoracaceae bacterium]